MAENNDDNNYGAWLLFFFCLGGAYALWYFFGTEISGALRWLRWGQMQIGQFFLLSDYAVTHPAFEQAFEFRQTMEVLPQVPAENISGAHIRVMSELAMKPLLIPFAIILCAFGVIAMYKGPQAYYRRSMGLDQLIEAQSDNFPTIAPFADFNPQDMPFRVSGEAVPSALPIFSEALAPEEWIAYNMIPMPDGQLDKRATGQAFAKQLGPRWQGYRRLKAEEQILLAAFCLKAARKREDADQLLGQIALCWSAKDGLKIPSPLVNRARAILRNDKIAKPVLKKCEQHAYVTTALIRALDTAREEGGVLAPASFVWLRGHNRALWYALNNLGRQAMHPEALGAMTHYMFEKVTHRPILKPRVENAIEALDEYMNSGYQRPVPPLDYSYSQKGHHGGVMRPKHSVGERKVA